MLAPVEYHFFEHLMNSQELDNYLAAGFFRTSNYMMLTRVMLYNNEVYNLFHIRYNLMNYTLSKSLKKLYRKVTCSFYNNVRPFENSKEKEALFLKHKKRFANSGSVSLEQYLNDYDGVTRFNTYEINLYDKTTNKLIGYSIFDLGSNSLASILCVYDEAYSKYSLGIATMAMEIIFAKEEGCTYYYPGYIADKPSPFNYKTRLGANPEYYNWFSKNWEILEDINTETKVSDIYERHLKNAETWLDSLNIKYKRTRNPYYFMKYHYANSKCMASIEQILLTDYSTNDKYIIVEYHPVLGKLVVSCVVAHVLDESDVVSLDENLADNVWKTILLYLYPNYYIESQQDLERAIIKLINQPNTNHE